MNPIINLRLAALCLAALAVIQCQNLTAANVTWNNGAGDGLWTSAGNWTGGSGVPGTANSDVAIIGGTLPATISAASAAGFTGMQINRAVTINNGTLNMNATANPSGMSGVLQIYTGSYNAAIGSAVTFSGTGASGFLFRVNDTYSGILAINGAVSATTAGAANFVSFSGAAGTTGDLQFNSTLSLTKSGGNTDINVDFGTVEFNGANTFSLPGSLRLNSDASVTSGGKGVLKLGNGSALPSSGIAGGFSIGATDAGLVAGNNYELDLLQTAANTIAAGVEIRNLASINVLGADISAGGTATYSGNIKLDKATTSNTGTAGSIVLKSVQANTTTEFKTGVISDNGSGTVLRNLTIGNATTGLGTVKLSGANTYTGGTTLAGGTLQAGSSSALGASTGSLTVNGGTLDLNGNSLTVGAFSGSGGTIKDNGGSAGTSTLTLGDATTPLTFSGTFANGSTRTVAMTKQGSGSLTLATANTHTGGTTVNGGTLTVSGSGTFGGSGNNLTLGAATLDLAGTTQTGNSLLITGAGTVQNGTLTLATNANASGMSGILQINTGSYSAAVNSALSFSASTTSGTVALIRMNDTYTGTLTFGSTITDNNNIGAAGSPFLDISGTAGTTGTSIFNGAISVTRTTGNATINLARGTAQLNAANTWSITGGGTLRIAPAVTSGTGVLKLGNGSALGSVTPEFGSSESGLSGNTYEMDIMQTAANTVGNSLVIRNSQLNTVIGADIAGGGTATYSGGAVYLREASNAGTDNGNGAGNVIFKSVQANTTTIVSGTIQDNINVAGVAVRPVIIGDATTGLGTVKFTGPNTYTGTTTISGGKLLVATGSGTRCASAVTVNNTAGCIFAAQLAAANGQWASTSSLTVGGANSEVDVDYNGTTPTTSTFSDPIRVTTLTATSGGTLKVLGITTSTPGGTYPLINGTTAVPAAADPYTGLTLSPITGVSARLTTTANHVNLVLTPVITTSGSLTAMTTTYGTAGTAQNFTVSGVNMAAGITVMPPTGFEVSTVSDFSSNVGNHSSPITVGSAGAIASTTIYVRLAATASVGTSGGNVVCSSSSGGAASQNVATGSPTVNPKAASVTANAQTKIYGDVNPTLTATVVGTVNSDTLSYTLATTVTQLSSVGQSNITVTLGSNLNYTVLATNGTLTINPLAINVTANATNKTYGTADPTLSYGHTPSLVAGDSFSGGLTRVAGENVGSYAINQGTLSLSANYTLNYTGANLTINPASLSITANNAGKSYGQTMTFAGIEFSASGLVAGDSVSSVTLTSAGATNTAGAGNYTIAPGAAVGSGLGNYNITYANGTLTVNPALLGVTANNTNVVYGSTIPVFTVSYTGFQNSDSLGNSDVVGAPALTTSTTINTPVGTYVITNTLGTLASTNYTFALTNGTLTVVQAAITVTANNQGMTYGSAVPTLTASYSGFVNGDTASVISGAPSLTTSAATNSSVGSYTITNTLGTLSATNYAFTLVNGTLTVTQASLTITAANESTPYGTGYPFAGNEYTVAGLLNSDGVSNVTLSATGGTTGTSTVGGYTITPSAATGSGLGNYAISYVTGTLTVNPLAVTVTANPLTKVYGQADPGLTYTVNPALVNGDTFSGALNRAAGENVGGYAISQGSLSVSTNYTLGFVGTNLTITTASLTITANNASKTYGQNLTLSNLAFTNSPLVSGDSVTSVTLTCAGLTNGANAGTYAITPSAAAGSGLSNYNVTYANGTLTISVVSAGLSLSSSLNPAGYLASLTFSASVNTNATGTVVFSSATGAFSTNTFVNGAATSRALSTLPRGTNLVTAAYSGDANYSSSTAMLYQVITNHPPVAVPMSVEVTSELPAEILVSDIATNWSDVDGDSVALTAIYFTSTNGVTMTPINLTTNGGGAYAISGRSFLGYTSSALGADQISYTISDGQGGSTTGYINLTLKNAAPGTSSITSIVGGVPTTVTAYGVTGFTYITQRSTDLNTGVWVNVATNTAATNGVIIANDPFSDQGGTQPASVFYRLLWEPRRFNLVAPAQ